MEALKRVACLPATSDEPAKKGTKKIKAADKEGELMIRCSMLVVSMENRLRALESVCFQGVLTVKTCWVVDCIKKVHMEYDKSLKNASTNQQKKAIHAVPQHLYAAAECLRMLSDKKFAMPPSVSVSAALHSLL